MSKVSAIIPAFNEQANILNVLEVVVNSPLIEEVIVVDDGSTDQTVVKVKKAFPKVIIVSLTENQGKANALLAGAKQAKNPILFFCDADLIGLNKDHLKKLISPVKKGQVAMMGGSQEYMKCLPRGKRAQKKLNKQIYLTKAIGGEKVLWKKDFLEIKNLKNSHYRVEQIIIADFLKKEKPFELITLKGISHIHKFKKWGLIQGIKKELPIYINLVPGFIKIIYLRLKKNLKKLLLG